MSSDDSDAEPLCKRRRKPRRLEDSPESNSSGSPIIGNSSRLRMIRRARQQRTANVIGDSGSDSDDSGSSIVQIRKRKVAKVESDSDDSSDSSFVRRTGKPRKLESDSEDTDNGFESSSQWETDIEQNSQMATNNSITMQDNSGDSDSSNGTSDKCPICLLRFKNQEVGTPESCDHMFCLECLQEWSKNMNTCPVDRQEYSMILARKNLDGEITRRLPVEKPSLENFENIIDDPTFCEICGSRDNEDRMLLCDGCDQGFHMYCLEPPLDNVPEGAWYCPGCQSGIHLLSMVVVVPGSRSSGSGRYARSTRPNNRSVPRTGQTERVRRQIASNRQQNSQQNDSGVAGSASGSLQDSVSSSTSNRTKRTKKHKKSKKKSRSQLRYKTVYEIDKVTGLTIAVQKRQVRRKQRSARKVKKKSVKGRIARQLGLGANAAAPQNSIGASGQPDTISGLRHQAGIPTLHLFGRANELDYFSEPEEEYEVGPQLLTRRAPNQSDVAAIRRLTRRKTMIDMPATSTVSSSTDLLDSILNSQEQFHSRHASFSVDREGKFKIEVESRKDKYKDLNKEQSKAKETPNGYNPNRSYGGGGYNNRYRNYQSNYNRRHSSYNSYNNGNQNNYYTGGGNSGPSSSWQNNFNRYGGGRGGDYDCPQDYTQRTLCASSDPDYPERRDENNDNNADSELDIYSDIETVTTSRADEPDYNRPPSPPQAAMGALNTAEDEENNDSEPDMVIDDEKGHEDYREDTAVSSTVGFGYLPPPPMPPNFDFIDQTSEIQSEAIQSSQPSYYRDEEDYAQDGPQSQNIQSSQPSYYKDEEDYGEGCPNASVYSQQTYNAMNDTQEDQEEEEDEGCPNFSIYSRESKSMALHTDLTMSAHQVSEVSSSPNIETQGKSEAYDPEVPSYDDDEAANDVPQTDLYDPEDIKSPSVEDSQDRSDIPIPPEPPVDNIPVPEESQKPTADEERNKPDAEEHYDPEHVLNENDEIEIHKDETEQIPSKEQQEVVEQQEVMEQQEVTEQQKVTEQQEVTAQANKDDWKSSEEKLNDSAATPVKPPKTIIISKVDIIKPGGVLGGLYSDSEDESVVKKDGDLFGVTETNKSKVSDDTEHPDDRDINQMTEDIVSEEERSYTPCLDEKKRGIEGLDTEMISDEDRNDFDESHEKTENDGETLQLNATECELELRPEDYEEGEIVDKGKESRVEEDEKSEAEEDDDAKKAKSKKEDKEKKSKKKEKNKEANKENEKSEKGSFKKLSKSSKGRNYRGDKDKDKQKDKSKSKEKESKEKDKEKELPKKKKEKRKEIERYNVRALVAEKPAIKKDEFGRDIRPTPPRSRSGSYTPPPPRRSISRHHSPIRHPRTPTPRRSPSTRRRSLSPRRRSVSRRRSLSPRRRSMTPRRRSPSPRRRSLPPHRRRSRSRSRDRSRKRRKSGRSRSRSGSRSPVKKRTGSKNKKRKRSTSRHKRDKSKSRKKARKNRGRSRSRSRSKSESPRRMRMDWTRPDWTPEYSMSPLPPMSPSWTPPRLLDSQMMRNQNLAVTVNNTKKKKDKRKKDKRNKEASKRRRRFEREKTPPPSKEVFASGDNILVSVSFNNENEVRDVTTRDKNREGGGGSGGGAGAKKKKKRNKQRRDLSGVKPVAIIDLARSPFRELTPSPRNVIVLTDSDTEEAQNANGGSGGGGGGGGSVCEKGVCDSSSQQVASPERPIAYATGPKTPPEPAVKFSLCAKQPTLRAISNPLIEPDDLEMEAVDEEDIHAELENRLAEGMMHKGPNTPPEPPNSPPSSPDAYDPFEPTKSRSPTPEPGQNQAGAGGAVGAGSVEESVDNNIDRLMELDQMSLTNPPAPQEVPTTSLTPPLLDVQPADSQSSVQATPESTAGGGGGKSPERPTVPGGGTGAPTTSASSSSAAPKPMAQTTPFSTVPTAMGVATSASATTQAAPASVAPSRIQILNSTVIPAPATVVSTIPQRIVLPNQVKSGPVKINPTKPTVKSTPIKPMPNKTTKIVTKKKPAAQLNSSLEDITLDFDSPYSPGSSDYDDLFEPPSEIVTKPVIKGKTTNKSPQKHVSVFDALFGSSPTYKPSNTKQLKTIRYKKNSSGTTTKTKTVGVKLDEDCLKILDELPNSAVEMQVKDKFLKKLNRQERVVEEVKFVLKPHYNKKRITKEEYKDILRRAVPKICHNKSGEINPTKIKNLIEAYVRKVRHSKKVTSSSSVPQKV